MEALARHEGSWAGTNGFRLMPDDPLRDAPLTARVAPAAGGVLTEVRYVWSHAGDGEQSGLLALGAGEEDGSALALWGDSWHQHPAPKVLDGTAGGGVVTVAYSYAGGWRWEVVVDASSPDVLVLTMNNVIPESAATPGMPAGPYAAMRAELRRAG